MCWTWSCGDWALYFNLCTHCTAKPTMLWMLAVWHTAHTLTRAISETDSTWVHLLDVYWHREWTGKLEVGPLYHLLNNSVIRLCVFCPCVGCDVNTVASDVSKLWKSPHVHVHGDRYLWGGWRSKFSHETVRWILRNDLCVKIILTKMVVTLSTDKWRKAACWSAFHFGSCWTWNQAARLAGEDIGALKIQNFP